MLKKLKTSFITALTFFLLVTFALPINAEESLFINEDNINELEQFIEVVENQFVLNIPENVVILDSVKNEVLDQLEENNRLIEENYFYIDPVTKISEAQIMTFAYGFNSVKITWNSIIVEIDAGLLKVLANLATGLGVGAIAIKLAAVIPALEGHPHLTGLAGSILGEILAGTLYDKVIKDGVEIHTNIITQFYPHIGATIIKCKVFLIFR